MIFRKQLDVCRRTKNLAFATGNLMLSLVTMVTVHFGVLLMGSDLFETLPLPCASLSAVVSSKVGTRATVEGQAR